MKVRKFKSTSLVWVLCNKLLSNFTCLSHAGEYWPLLVLVQTLLCSVWTAMIMAVQTERCGPHAQLGRSYFFCFELAVLVFMAISVESFQWWLQGGCSRFEVDCKNCLWIKVKIVINNDVLMFMWLQIYKIIWSKGSEHQQYQADAWWFCCNRFLCEQYILV